MTCNEDCGAKIGNSVKHLGELYTDQYKNGQGIEKMRKEVPTTVKAVRVQTVQPFKSLK
jgi:hypothetical protein